MKAGIFSSRTIVIEQSDIDTDQIIPARFLLTTTQSGLGPHAFNDWRYNSDGSMRDDCQLNTVDTSTHAIIVAGANFGCGSSREHAAWALRDFGVRAVISTRIADIFRNNAIQNGIIPIEIDAEHHASLLEFPGAEITVNLTECTAKSPFGVSGFPLSMFHQTCLVRGVDELGFLLDQIPAIEAFEESRI